MEDAAHGLRSDRNDAMIWTAIVARRERVMRSKVGAFSLRARCNCRISNRLRSGAAIMP
jgi:hypothetical protein